MKPIMIILALVLAVFASGHTPAPAPAANAQMSQPQQQSETTKGTNLVERLPRSVHGVMLQEGALRVKPGFKFVKKGHGRFAIARRSNGGTVGLGGCGCKGGGDCQPKYTGGIITCQPVVSCSGSCTLALTIGGVRTDIIRY
jgi:hypothetical protein